MKYGGITPGPWEVAATEFKGNAQGLPDHTALSVYTEGEQDKPICLVAPSDNITDEDRANAQLIADAPKLLKQRDDLLAALSEAALTIETLLSVDDDSPGRELDYNDADKVLVKIEGTLAEIKEDSNK